VVPIVIGVIVLLGLVAVFASRNSSSNDGDGGTGDSATAEYQPVAIAGDALPPLPDSGSNDPAVGTRMPEIKGRSFDGSQLDILPDGTPKVIFFLAHWCPHCQREVPLVVDWINQSGDPDNVGLYAVATGTSPERPNYPPSAWLRRSRWPIPTIADDERGTAANAVGLTGFPFYVATSGDGTVVARRSGELTVSQLEQLVDLARQADNR
jgi:thiol-disulfide isomerase/thioredoxin